MLLLRRPVVILAERDKEDMDVQLRRALRGSSLEWHTRSGAPHALADLEKVAAGQARTVILLQPDSEQVRRSFPFRLSCCFLLCHLMPLSCQSRAQLDNAGCIYCLDDQTISLAGVAQLPFIFFLEVNIGALGINCAVSL